jgi:hypothetical protein
MLLSLRKYLPLLELVCNRDTTNFSPDTMEPRNFYILTAFYISEVKNPKIPSDLLFQNNDKNKR